jgi:hypothetical protein
MELASMLAGERFTDHPRSVCPVIGAFLRYFNDRVDDDARRRLYDVAACVVATRGPRALRRERIRRCRERLWALEDRGRLCAGPRTALTAGTECAAAFVRHGRTDEALAFVYELIALSGDMAGPGRVAAPAGHRASV